VTEGGRKRGGAEIRAGHVRSLLVTCVYLRGRQNILLWRSDYCVFSRRRTKGKLAHKGKTLFQAHLLASPIPHDSNWTA
jgi:hypothetical protein